MKRIRCGRIISDGKIFPGYVYYENGVIAEVSGRDLPCGEEYDAGEFYLAPGFIDTHTHGGADVDFTFCDAQEAIRAADFHFSHGTTTIFPTTLASDYENTARALRELKKAQASGAAKGEIGGAHIEGPYFAPSMAGAQNPKYLTDPVEKDYTRILDEFGGFVKKWSYAPERDRDAKFCRYLIGRGVLASAGHTAAIYDDMLAAYDAGLRCVTHLYSCTSTITREKGFRRLGVIECAYLFEDMDAELISDGKHIPKELIRLVFRLKGAEHIMLVTDSLSIAGSGKTSGELNGVPYIVEDGVAKLADRSAFAGSVATADRLVAECVAAGVPLKDAVRAMTETPARALKLNKGRIAKGYDADFVIFDDKIAVKRVISRGR